MARTEPAILRVLGQQLDLVESLVALSIDNDGVIDPREQHVINSARDIASALEVGNRARLRAQAIENSWSLEDSPYTVRTIRELRRDLGNDPLEAA